MKDKVKTIINYIIILVIVIIVYIFFVIGIKKMIPTYQNYLLAHKNENNVQTRQINEGDIEKYLKQLITESKNVEALSKTDLNELLANEPISKINKAFIRGNQMDQQNIETLKVKDKNIGEIYYISILVYKQENYTMIFTKNMKNIYLAYYGYNQGISENSATLKQGNTTEGEIENTSKIIEKLKNQLEKMGIKLDNPIEPDIMYWREYDISNTYTIEDTKNNLAIVYDAMQDKILRLTLGFEKIQSTVPETTDQEEM